MGGPVAAHFFLQELPTGNTAVVNSSSSKSGDFEIGAETNYGRTSAHSATPELLSPTRIPAVYDEIASGEITARIRRQVYDCGRDLARFADTAHRRKF